MGWIMGKLWFDSRQNRDVSPFSQGPRPSLIPQMVRGNISAGMGNALVLELDSHAQLCLISYIYSIPSGEIVLLNINHTSHCNKAYVYLLKIVQAVNFNSCNKEVENSI